MKSNQIIWCCDLCSKEQTFTEGRMGEPYFPGWIMIDIISSHGHGVSSSGEVSGQKVFCCLACAVAFLKRVSERKKKRDERDEEQRKNMFALRKDLAESFSKEDIG